MYISPYAPEESRYPPVHIDLLKEFLYFCVKVHLRRARIFGPQFKVCPYVLLQEVTPLGPGRNGAVVTIKADPFSEVVCDIERGGRRDGIFIVDECDNRPRFILARKYYDIAAQKIAVGENELRWQGRIRVS